MQLNEDQNQTHVDGFNNENFTDTLPAEIYPLTIVHSAVFDAMEAKLLKIECTFTRGFSGFHLIGNTSEICRDGKERVKAALEKVGINIPPRKLVISFTPADIKKDGNQFDLPIAVSLSLLLKSDARAIDPSKWLFAAELGLSGELRPTKGIVSFAVAAISEGLEGIVVANENVADILKISELTKDLVKPIGVKGFSHLQDVLSWMFNPSLTVEMDKDESKKELVSTPSPNLPNFPNFDDMILNPILKKAALTVCTGLHSILLRGSPGTGKSMFAARLPSILPKMNEETHIDAMKIHSAFSEKIPQGVFLGTPPFRSPHHQASAVAIMGNPHSPGELALAHGGILFLDELSEFRRDLLEALREPLETGEVRVSRANKKIVWKARVILVAASNNCPCGWFASTRRACRCTTQKFLAYNQKLSGPILERIDIHLNMLETREKKSGLFIELARGSTHQQTKNMASLVKESRTFAGLRNMSYGVMFNRDLQAAHLIEASGLSKEQFSELVNAIVPRHASSRSVIRALRVSRTLADLDFSSRIREEDLKQAWSWQAEPAAKERGEEAFGLV